VNRCLCKKEISDWLFNFSEDENKFEKNNILGEKLKLTLLAIRNSTKSKVSIETLLINIEHKEELRKWFLREIKKLTNKDCYGWQCRFKILRINKKCNVHNKKEKK
jgi:hypothetical protein